MLATRRAPIVALALLGAIGCAGESPTAPGVTELRVTRVEISPKAGVTLPAAGTQRFSARAFWSDSQYHEASLVYEASDGSIDSTGSLRAPRRGGQVRVIARTKDGQAADTAIVGVLAPTLSSLTISPKTATIETSSSLQLAVTALWSEGSDSVPSLTWSAPQGGSVSSSGEFTSPSVAGSYRVVVAHQGGTIRDTAVITVAAPTLTRLTISPKTLIMAAGSQHQFTASAEWSDGSSTLPALSWSRLGAGTISSTGRYTAPSTAGTYGVVVRNSSGTVRDTAVVTVLAPTVTSFSLSPATIRLQRGQSVQLSTATTWSDGATRSVTVSYAATGGTVANGVYTAGQVAGTFLIIATCGCGSADSSSVIVEPPTLTSISISPSTVSLQTGASQNFTATALWSDNSTTLPALTFTKTGGGSINATTGAYTAPGTEGSYLVIVAPQGSTLRDTATVTVTAAPPPPPPVGDFVSNLPTGVGLSLITDTEFGNLLPAEQFNADGLAYAWDGRNATDPSATYGTGVFETFYPAGSTGNGDGGASLFGPNNRNWRRFYFSIYVWVPSNYVMHNTGGEKFFYPIVRAGGSEVSSTMFNWHLMGAETATSPTFSFYVDPQIGGSRVYQNHSARPVKGSYQRIEMYAVMNTPGQNNGIWRVWVNGALAADYSNIRYSNAGTQATFDGIRFEGVRGGPNGTIPVPAGGQVRRYDRLAFYASTN